MSPNVIFKPQTSRGVYSPNSPKNSSMRYFNVSYHTTRTYSGYALTVRLRRDFMSSRSSASSACQGNKLYEVGGGSSQKVKDPAQGRVPRKLHTATTYPLVTTGGGALPLPTPVPQPATLRRASTAAIAKAIFFMGSPLVMTEAA
jgi:hypothetical protein